MVKLYRCFEVVFSTALLIILVLCIQKTQHNAAWYKMLFVTIAFVVILFSFYKGLLRREQIALWLEQKERRVLTLFLAGWGVALYGFSAFSRNEPTGDYASVYQIVCGYVENPDTVNWEYLSKWSNNFGDFYLQLQVARVCKLVGVKDFVYVMLALNVLAVLAAGYCLYGVLRMCRFAVPTCFMALFMMAAFVPIWGGVNYFYTDSLSLGFGIWASFFFLKGITGEKHFKQSGYYFMLAGIIWGIGYVVKATVAIAMIAAVICLLFTATRRQVKNVVGTVTIIVISFLIVVGSATGIRKTFPAYEKEESIGAPIVYWLGLGLTNNGSYSQNEEFANQLLSIEGKSAKKEFAWEYIAENKAQLWNSDHIVSKVRCNFASGNMGLSDYNAYSVNPMYEVFNDYGRYGGYTTIFTSGYFYAILLMGALAGVCAFGKWDAVGELNLLRMLATLSIAGLFLFLMLWEANNRQLYNHIPWFAAYAATGMEGICRIGKLRKSDKQC